MSRSTGGDWDRAKRQKELQAKREKLKRLRAERKARQSEQKQKKRQPKAQSTPKSPESASDSPRVSSPSPADNVLRNAEIEQLLSSFKEITDASSVPSDTSQTSDPPESASSTAGEKSPEPRKREEAGREVKLEKSDQKSYDVPPREVSRYERDTQTDSDEIARRNAPPEEEIRQKKEAEEREKAKVADLELRLKNAELELQRQKDLAKQMEKKEPKELSSADCAEILESDSFLKFFRTASLHVERALAQPDITAEYFSENLSEQQEDQKELIIERGSFKDSKLCDGRAVTSIDWSPEYPHLFIASYAGSPDDSLSDAPDGVVAVWSLRLSSRPESVFTCQAAVLCAQFHPKNHKLIFGGTSSGQIVIWDTRQKQTPSVRTRFSNGHIHPVYCIALVSSVQSRESLISISNDGILCVWNDLLLIEPSLRIHLQIRRKEEVTTPAVGFPSRDMGQLVLGSDEGDLYKAKIYDEKPGIHSSSEGHAGPVTSVSFHPATKETPSEVADLFLTCSYDWTCKLWSSKATTPLTTFEFARAYVLDVQWSPVHPAVFAMSDASGVLSIWNLNEEMELPVLIKKMPSDIALARIRWAADGKQIAAGDSGGGITIFDISPEVALPKSGDALKFYHSIKNPKIFRDR